jgi:two-component system, NtrC family, nitrogen regulation sensor histidine kinase NtrY
MALGRFERKILGAMAAVALVLLSGALLLGQRALREAYAVGVNEQVEGELDRGLALYNAHFAALRADAERTRDAVASDYALNAALAVPDPAAAGLALDALLVRNLNVVSIAVPGEPPITRTRPLSSTLGLRTLTLAAPLAHLPGVSVEVTVGTQAETFGDYLRAGEVREVFHTLRQRSAYVSGFYVAIYVTLLFSVIAVALAVGFLLARRVTRRVTELARATERVGAGRLDVSVPDDADDEVGELTRAFNSMVRDMRESRQRIEYLSRIGAWQEFARRLAHEIKNPLTPIQLAVQELHRSYRGDDPRFKRTLEDARVIVEEEIATLRRLVGEFSEFARLPEVHLAPHDLGVFVREAVDSPFRADESGDEEPVRVVAETDLAALPVQIDAMLLKRCVDNLVRNARQALLEAHVAAPLVVVAARRAQGADRVLLEVRDNGPGVPETVRDRVFDPYYTTKAEGTGLGLAIVKKIVLEHGGEIGCGVAREGGARFTIELPPSRGLRTTTQR